MRDSFDRNKGAMSSNLKILGLHVPSSPLSILGSLMYKVEVGSTSTVPPSAERSKRNVGGRKKTCSSGKTQRKTKRIWKALIKDLS